MKGENHTKPFTMNAFLFYRNYGLAGLLLYLKLKLGRIKNLSIPHIESIIHLRPDTSDQEVFDQIFLDREYDLNLPFVPEIIVDAGANIGLTSVFFANKYPGAKIISIEPEASNYNALVKNTAYYMSIVPIHAAIWNEPGLVEVLDVGTGEWGFMLSQRNGPQEGIGQIQAITIQEILNDLQLSHIDILKMDIEGSEKELFSTNFETWLPKIRCLIIEIHDNLKKGTSKTVLKALSKYSFSFSLKKGSLVFINEDFSPTIAQY